MASRSAWASAIGLPYLPASESSSRAASEPWRAAAGVSENPLPPFSGHQVAPRNNLTLMPDAEEHVISHDVRDPSHPDRNLALELVRVTEAGALAAGRWVGR